MRPRSTRFRTGLLGSCLALLAAATALIAVGPAAATTIPPGTVKVFNSISGFTSADKSQRVNCPAGQVVLGGGAATGNPHVIISAAKPVSDATGSGFTVTAQEDEFGVTGTWAVQVFAFCAVAPPGYQVVPTPPTAVSSPSFGNATGCPTGKFPIGAGGEITGGAGQVDLGLLAFNDGNGQPISVEALAKTDADGFGGTYSSTVYAICASQRAAGDFTTVRSIAVASGSAGGATATCPSGFRATAGGGFTATAGTRVQLFEPDPSLSPTQVSVNGSAPVPPSVTWAISAYAFCAR
jgi:hypothetical protein